MEALFSLVNRDEILKNKLHTARMKSGCRGESIYTLVYHQYRMSGMWIKKEFECVELTVAVPFPNSSMSIRDLSPAN